MSILQDYEGNEYYTSKNIDFDGTNVAHIGSTSEQKGGSDDDKADYKSTDLSRYPQRERKFSISITINAPTRSRCLD